MGFYIQNNLFNTTEKMEYSAANRVFLWNMENMDSNSEDKAGDKASGSQCQLLTSCEKL